LSLLRSRPRRSPAMTPAAEAPGMSRHNRTHGEGLLWLTLLGILPAPLRLTGVELVSYSIHECAELTRTRRMTQFPECLGFDLADAFAGDCERLSHFLERVLAAVFETEAHLDDFFFARRQRAQNLSGLVLEVHVDHSFGRRNYGTVFDEIAQVRIFLFTDWGFK